jgi:NTP pyrophosphatase (non-canonical NTP hydrolase)
MSIVELAINYIEKRGLIITETEPTGRKLSEEVIELIIALATNDHVNALEEIADVAICLGIIANKLDTSVEECILAKTVKDTGRG